jgi:hypothetical protein
MRLIILGLISMTTVAVAQSRLADFYLDIVTYQFSSEVGREVDASLPSGGISAGSNSRRTSPGLLLEIISPEKWKVEVGDPLVYEVLIQNMGPAAVTLPWSPDVNLFPLSSRLSMPGFAQGSLWLEVQSGEGTGRRLDTPAPHTAVWIADGLRKFANSE